MKREQHASACVKPDVSEPEQSAVLADDMLWGALEIGEYIGRSERAVYHIAARKTLPITHVGGRLAARKSRLDRATAGE
jgi:hypothetical protein